MGEQSSGRPSQANRGPKNQGRSGAVEELWIGMVHVSSSPEEWRLITLLSFQDIQIRRSPFPKSANARLLIDPWTPIQELAGLSYIADVARLIARSPPIKIYRSISPG